MLKCFWRCFNVVVFLKKNGICIELAYLLGGVNFMLDIDDKDKKDSGTPPHWSKPLKQFLIIIVILLVLRLVFIRVEAAMEGMTASSSFMRILRDLRNHIISYVMDEKQGIDENYVITNEKEFLSGLKETVYKPFHGINMKKCFEAGSFKILIKDNVCYIYTDLTKASQYFSGKPLILRNNIAHEAAFVAQRYWKEGNPSNVLQRGVLLPQVSIYLFLSKPDITYLNLFTKEMNDFYLPVFVFRNIPSISLGEIS